MPLKISLSKTLRVAVVALVCGLGIVWLQTGQYRSKHDSPLPSEVKRMKTPLIQGRAATAADVNSGAAIFYVRDGRSAPYSLGRDLPIKAEVVKSESVDLPVGRQVVIVQAEITDGQHITLGVLDGDKQVVCAMEDVKLLD